MSITFHREIGLKTESCLRLKRGTEFADQKIFTLKKVLEHRFKNLAIVFQKI